MPFVSLIVAIFEENFFGIGS